MERATAIKKLGKMLGPKFGYRIDAKAPTAEEREAAAVEAKTLNAEYKEAEEAETARRTAILAGDAEYQRLRSETKRLRTAKDKAWSQSRRYRFMVGKTVAGMFFSVIADGDSWEDVIQKASKERVI